MSRIKPGDCPHRQADSDKQISCCSLCGRLLERSRLWCLMLNIFYRYSSKTREFLECLESYCVIELDKHQWFSAARCSMDIAPGCWRGQRSDVGASSRSSSRHVVRGGRAAPRGRRFWETPSVANLSAASSAAEGESLARLAIRKA